MDNLIYEYFEQFLNQQDVDEQLKKAMIYSLISNGKLIRPLVFFTFLNEFNINEKNYVNIACAIEMIHCYSLVHDDLPAMDDDTYRRGRLTTHKKFDEALAILTGDALLTHAFEVMIDNELLKDSDKIKLINELVKCSGSNNGMINGQVLDINNENKVISEKMLEQIHFQKTSRMLQLPATCALIVGDKLELYEDVNELMETLGLLYQVRDDYLDYYGNCEIGKDSQSDMNNGKYTYVNIYATEEKLLNYIEDLKKQCYDIVEKLNFSTNVIQLIQMFGDRSK